MSNDSLNNWVVYSSSAISTDDDAFNNNMNRMNRPIKINTSEHNTISDHKLIW